MAEKILKVVPGVMALGLVGKNLKLVKKPTTKNLVKAGVTNLIGVPLIKAVSSSIK